jgi:hypothetical protein
MKQLIISLIFLAKFYLVSGQHFEDIRFIYVGEQLHPIGTRVVCIGKLVQPDNCPDIDSIWGSSILTDEKTFDSIKNYAFRSNLSTMDTPNEYAAAMEKSFIPGMRIHVRLARFDSRNVHNGPDYYLIGDSTGDYVYVRGQHYREFMDGLKEMLQRNNLDKNVIKFFGGIKAR